ncbi:MAG: pilus assembly protein PilM, partial [Clostridiales bacterium]|nr:pilus assembly protein PilM [Clostridiales bacterium]
HNGQKVEADVVATFLPAGVVESIYAVVNRCDVEVESLTLEPIAAMNVTIPSDLRLLNLAMIDIGAGTSDIAVCRDGSVVGYTMATVAGDEITETIMREFLVDFPTAEQIKANLAGTVSFTDILGLEQTIDARVISSAIQPALSATAKELAQKICEVNGGTVPSAVFLAGGGSKLVGLGAAVAEALGIEPRRVAIAGSHFKSVVFSEEENILDPIYATPLGIAASAGLGLISNSYRLLLNGKQACLFRSGYMSALDVLLMNGFTYGDLIGRSGKSLMVYVNEKKHVFYGETATPSVLKINGTAEAPSTVIRSGDNIEFTPAVSGGDAVLTLDQLLTKLELGLSAKVNGSIATGDQMLCWGDEIVTDISEAADDLFTRTADAKSIEAGSNEILPSTSTATGEWHFILNDRPLTLPAKTGGDPYYLMDLLECSGIDFDHLNAPVAMKINGENGQFTQILKENDHVMIHLMKKEDN